MKQLLNKLVKEEKGQGMTEYGLILGLIAVVVVGAVTLMGGTIETKFEDVIKKLGGSPNTASGL